MLTTAGGAPSAAAPEAGPAAPEEEGDSRRAEEEPAVLRAVRWMKSGRGSSGLPDGREDGKLKHDERADAEEAGDAALLSSPELNLEELEGAEVVCGVCGLDEFLSGSVSVPEELSDNSPSEEKRSDNSLEMDLGSGEVDHEERREESPAIMVFGRVTPGPRVTGENPSQESESEASSSSKPTEGFMKSREEVSSSEEGDDPAANSAPSDTRAEVADDVGASSSKDSSALPSAPSSDHSEERPGPSTSSEESDSSRPPPLARPTAGGGGLLESEPGQRPTLFFPEKTSDEEPAPYWRRHLGPPTLTAGQLRKRLVSVSSSPGPGGRRKPLVQKTNATSAARAARGGPAEAAPARTSSSTEGRVRTAPARISVDEDMSTLRQSAEKTRKEQVFMAVDQDVRAAKAWHRRENKASSHNRPGDDVLRGMGWQDTTAQTTSSEEWDDRRAAEQEYVESSNDKTSPALFYSEERIINRRGSPQRRTTTRPKKSVSFADSTSSPRSAKGTRTTGDRGVDQGFPPPRGAKIPEGDNRLDRLLSTGIIAPEEVLRMVQSGELVAERVMVDESGVQQETGEQAVVEEQGILGTTGVPHEASTRTRQQLSYGELLAHVDRFSEGATVTVQSNFEIQPPPRREPRRAGKLLDAQALVRERLTQIPFLFMAEGDEDAAAPKDGTAASPGGGGVHVKVKTTTLGEKIHGAKADPADGKAAPADGKAAPGSQAGPKAGSKSAGGSGSKAGSKAGSAAAGSQAGSQRPPSQAEAAPPDGTDAPAADVVGTHTRKKPRRIKTPAFPGDKYQAPNWVQEALEREEERKGGVFGRIGTGADASMQQIEDERNARLDRYEELNQVGRFLLSFLSVRSFSETFTSLPPQHCHCRSRRIFVATFFRIFSQCRCCEELKKCGTKGNTNSTRFIFFKEVLGLVLVWRRVWCMIASLRRPIRAAPSIPWIPERRKLS